MKNNNKYFCNMKNKAVLILYSSIFMLILFTFIFILIKHDNKKNEKTYNYHFKENGEKISDTLIIDKSFTNLKDFQTKDPKLLKR